LKKFNFESSAIIGTTLRSMSSQSIGNKLSGRVAIVTASTDGIGFAIARRLAVDGASVVVSSRKEKNVNEAVDKLKSNGLNVSGIVCHVGKQEDRTNLIDFALKNYGGIDILVSNAGVNPSMGSFLDTTEKEFDKIFEINVKCAFMLTKEIVPHMEKRGKGSIIYISSIGAYQPFSLIGAYSVSKTALLGLTKAVAIQCASSNIRANCVCPGIIETRFSQPLWSSEAAREEMNRVIPLQRIGKPDEIAGIVSFLASDDSSYLTGESIAVAGGYFSRL